MSDETNHFYEFGRFRVNVAERLLLREGEIVPLTPKVFEILLALLENSGHVVSKDELMRRVWPETFVEEGNLTQNISTLRKALGDGQNGCQYIETIARRGYRFVASVRTSSNGEVDSSAQSFEQPAVAVAAQAMAETANPAVAQRDAEKIAQVTFAGRSLAWVNHHKTAAIFALLALIIATAGIIYFTGRGKPTGSTVEAAPTNVIDSIAVLPFANETADSDTEFFNDEITESLINNLSQLPKLRVVPRSLVVAYKAKQPDLRSIGRDLNVRAVLTGSVERVGDILNIQVELIDVTNMSHLWGQHYRRKISDILLMQEDISSDIFNNLRLKLNVEEERQLKAFNLYLKGRNYLNKRTEEGLQQGIEFFKQAIETDPNYAAAYAGLADCYNMLVVYGLSQPKDAFPQAEDAARRALKIDDTLAEAHTSLAFIRHRWTREREEAENEFKLAIKYKPGYAPAHQWYSSYLVALERFDEAVAEARRAQELDPLSFISNAHLGWVLYLAGRYDEAIEHCKKLLDVDPNFFPAHRYLGLAYEQQGKYKEAIVEFQEGVRLSGNPLMLALLGHAYAASSKRAEAERVLADLQGQKQRYVSPYTIAAIYAGLGERDEAFKWLERAFDERDIWLMNLKVDPVFIPLRSDKRFAELLRRIGLTA
ncbi:MAG TPA: tetratricopeptide repeat protein [Blastocatellia bacterium]|nr:tetratricopeptide repeat protein [Blastocatellia bacterium]